MREFSAPCVLFQLVEAWRNASASRKTACESLTRGWRHEFAQAVLAAPHGALNALVGSAHYYGLPEDLDGILHTLPATKDSPSGPNCWDVKPTGDYGQDTATGRFIAANLCARIRQSKNPDVLSRALESLELFPVKGDSAILVGFCNTLAEVMICAPLNCTVAQEAAEVYHKDMMRRLPGSDTQRCQVA